MSEEPKQAVLNIGMVGHVDHGKSTLVRALTGIWTDKHSEEIKRGISIKLGYADILVRKCPKCPEPDCYTKEPTCGICGSNTDILRKIAFVDSPGHESLMAVMLAGGAIINGAILVISANEPCPQPQTKEHLAALEILGVKNIIIAHNKVDAVDKAKALESYKQIKAFVKGTIAENAPIVPLSAHYNVNIDCLIQMIYEYFKVPEESAKGEALFLVARSFDINKPGALPDELKGGVVGGSGISGVLKVGDKIEIRPGIKVTKENRQVYVPLQTEIMSLSAGEQALDEAHPGGLIGIQTSLDPSYTKADSLVGSVVGHVGKLPAARDSLNMSVKLMERVVGSKDAVATKPIIVNEPLMLNVGTATTLGMVTSAVGGKVSVKLKIPICVLGGSRVALSRKVDARWRLIGYGEVTK